MRVLVYSDGPGCVTGFGRVIANIFGPMIADGFLRSEDISFFGINHDGSPLDGPFRVWPATSGMVQGGIQDPYGKLRFIDSALRGVFGQFDVLFALLDHFSLSAGVPINGQVVQFLPAFIQLARQQPNLTPFKTIQYIPVDGESIRPEWVTWTSQLVEFPVSYTQYGRRVLLDVCPSLEPKLLTIPHGTNPEIFFPVSSEQIDQFRSQALGLKQGDFLVSMVGRNQPRKDPVRCLQVFKEIRRSIPTAKAYFHCNVQDSMGHDLQIARANLQLPQDCVKFPAGFSEGVGVPTDVLNLVYNASDLVVTTARGEGWGLTVSEALTAGTPVLAPDHTSFSEILADGRGALVPPEPCRQVMLADNDQLRPVADVMAMAEKAVWLLRHPEERAAMAKKGREWALGITWKDHVVPQWKAIFDKCDPKKQATKPVRLAFNAGVQA